MKQFLSQINPWVRSLSIASSLALLSIAGASSAAPSPDLSIGSYDLPGGAPQWVIPGVTNLGDAPASRSVLRLTVHEIQRTRVDRTLDVIVPPIPAGGFVEVKVDASSILPAGFAMADTRFSLEADITDLISESNEFNNRILHF